MPIKVRVGQSDAIKILSSAGGGSIDVLNAKNVIGGIASVTQLNVTGISTFNQNVLVGESSIILEPNGQASFTGFTTFQGSEFNNHVFIRNPAGNTIIFKNEGDAFFNGIVTATKFDGQIDGDLTGTILTPSQTNITSLGTLESLNVSGIASIGVGVTVYGAGIVSATTFTGNSNTSTLSAFGFIKNDSTTNKTVFPIFVDNSTDATASLLTVDDGFMYNPSTGILSATTFKGTLDGNAGTATSLATARTIGGVLFDGTSNIDLPGVNTTGDQDTSGTSAGLSGTPDIQIRNLIGVGATFTGEVSYEDITNIDSIGIITARSGLNIETNGLVVNAGVSTFSDNVVINETLTISKGLIVNVGVSTFGAIATFGNNVFVDGTLTAGLIDGGSF